MMKTQALGAARGIQVAPGIYCTSLQVTTPEPGGILRVAWSLGPHWLQSDGTEMPTVPGRCARCGAELGSAHAE